MRKEIIGNCCICGDYEKLTEEHVPPRKAFNNNRYYIAAIDNENPFSTVGKKKFGQGGIKYFSLCARCNNNTGSWYADDYIKWCYYGIQIIQRSGGKTTLYHINEIYPLRIIKQIIVMFFSINGDFLSQQYPYLTKFVLDKNTKNLPPEIQVFAYFNIEGNPRYNSFSVVGDFSNSANSLNISEFTFPPYGFVLSFDDKTKPSNHLREITHFADFSYNTKWDVDLDLETLPTWMPYPHDYRSKKEIQDQLEKNKKHSTQQRL